MLPLPLAGGFFLGWALGANDSANVFGTAVASRVISFRHASILCALAVIAGAYFQGEAGIQTYRGLAQQSIDTVLIAAIAAALTVTFMTIRKLPISTSQAMVGAITGIGLATDSVNWRGLEKVIICWLATPVGALIIACLLYYVLAFFITLIPMSIFTRDKILWNGLVLMGIYGAYALGANNVANATGVFSQQFSAQGITDQDLALWGGISIAAGSITFSKKIMLSVGSDIMKLNAFTALIAVTSMALTVHVFAMIGVPVSTSQAIVGAIMGVGLIRNPKSVDLKALRRIGIGWLLTPAVALVLAAAGYAVFVR